MKAKWVEFSPSVATLIEVGLIAQINEHEASLREMSEVHRLDRSDELYRDTEAWLGTARLALEAVRASLAAGVLVRIDSRIVGP